MKYKFIKNVTYDGKDRLIGDIIELPDDKSVPVAIVRAVVQVSSEKSTDPGKTDKPKADASAK